MYETVLGTGRVDIADTLVVESVEIRGDVDLGSAGGEVAEGADLGGVFGGAVLL